METEEVTKLVDGIYKNILDKFNPGARQLISAGKAYLKALHGAAQASRVYVDALGRLGRNAQQGTWGGSSDVGTALMQIVGVYKEIQEQQMNILKAFYVDLLVPLEINLEKDTKVVQSEQKRFLQQHKQRAESYSKAAAAIKKQRKKRQSSAMEKELKNMQTLEEEKTKLDAFCEQSLKNAMTQERRRYGFVLERQCSLAKHWMAYHTAGTAALQAGLEDWQSVAGTREYLPQGLDAALYGKMRVSWPDEEGSDSSISALRKARSMDTSCLDVRSTDTPISPPSLPRAKSELQLSHILDEDHAITPTRRPQSMAVPPGISVNLSPWEVTPLCRALYAYLSSGDNQLSFLEGDMIAPLVTDRLGLGDHRTNKGNSGWQFGENLRTHCSGWFPLAYTEMVDENGSPACFLGMPSSITNGMTLGSPGGHSSGGMSRESPPLSEAPTPTSHAPPSEPSHDRSPQRMFGDTLLMHRNSKLFRRVTGNAATNSHPGPPPAAPAPVPSPVVPPMINKPLPQSHSANFNSQNHAVNKLKTSKSHYGFGIAQPTVQTLPLRDRTTTTVQGKIKPTVRGSVPVGNVSLHSSNDSGFSNEPPPQPEIDYSDDENGQTRVAIRTRKLSKTTPKSDTESRIRQTSSHGNLADDKLRTYEGLRSPYIMEDKRMALKRTKSFWRFGKSDGILEGMSLWKHRDLVDVVDVKQNDVENGEKHVAENGHEKLNINENDTNKLETVDTTRDVNSNKIEEKIVEYRERKPKRSFSSINSQTEAQKHFEFSKTEIDNRISKHKEIMSVNETPKSNENANVVSNGHRVSKRSEARKLTEVKKRDKSNSNSEMDNDFYDDDGDGLMLKTVKRKEILQQYDTSGTESVSSGSDPYDCIVVDDHLATARRDERKQKYQNNNNNTNEIEKIKITKTPQRILDENQTRLSFRTFRSEGNEKRHNNEEKKQKSEPDKLIATPSLLPRTRLVKTNSVGPTMQTVMKFEHEIGLMGYGSTLRDRMRVAGVNPNNGNTYGPWYDLWGQDESVRK